VIAVGYPPLNRVGAERTIHSGDLRHRWTVTNQA
jgi:hypothetical protein